MPPTSTQSFSNSSPPPPDGMVLITPEAVACAESLTGIPPPATASPTASTVAVLRYVTSTPSVDVGSAVPRTVSRAVKAMFACIVEPCAKPSARVKVKRRPTSSSPSASTAWWSTALPPATISSISVHVEPSVVPSITSVAPAGTWVGAIATASKPRQ